MKIGMVTACYKPVINGVTRMVALYKEALEELGHEVTVFTLGEPDPAGEDANVVRSPAIPLGKTGYYATFGYNREARERLREMDIIHCHHLLMSVEMAHRYGQCPVVTPTIPATTCTPGPTFRCPSRQPTRSCARSGRSSPIIVT